MSKQFIDLILQADSQPAKVGIPPTILSQTTEDVEAGAGTKLQLAVSFSGDPLPSVSIRKDGELLTSGVTVTDNTAIFVIDALTSNDIGDYVWLIKNRYGEDESQPVSVNVISSLPIGVIYNNVTPKLLNFSKLGTVNASDVGGKLQISGGSAFNEQDGLLVDEFSDADENVTMLMLAVIKSLTGALAIGKKSINGWYAISNYSTLLLNSGEVANNLQKSTDSLQLAVNDRIKLVYKSEPGFITCIASNLTKGTEVTLKKPVDYKAGLRQFNTSKFCIYMAGGIASVEEVIITRESYSGADVLMIGDSKTEGQALDLPSQRYWAIAAAQLGLKTFCFAGNGDRTIEQRKAVPTIVKYKPKVVAMCIGRNNMETTEGQNALSDDYDYMVTSFKAAGIKVIHIYPIPEPPLGDQNTVRAIVDKYSNDIKADPKPGFNLSTMIADGLHPNALGHQHTSIPFIAALKQAFNIQ